MQPRRSQLLFPFFPPSKRRNPRYRRGGSLRRLASTLTRLRRGAQTPGTATTAECNSHLERGPVSAARFAPTKPRARSNWSVLTLYGIATADRGVNGEPPDNAD